MMPLLVIGPVYQSGLHSPGGQAVHPVNGQLKNVEGKLFPCVKAHLAENASS